MFQRKIFVILISFLFVFFMGFKKKEKDLMKGLEYPETKKVDVVDDYFGTKVKDPYRWLEGDDKEVKNWVEAQNKVTFEYLNRIPYRDRFHQRLEELYNYPRYSSPIKAGDYYFFYKNDGLQDQSVIYKQKSLEGEPEVFLDPNKLSKDGTVRAYLSGFSKDNKYVAYNRSEGGSDWQEIRIKKVDTGEELQDRIKWVKFSGAAWYKDGFFYSGYDKPEKGEELTAKNKQQTVYYHKLGESQDKDKVVFTDPEHPLRYYWASVSENQKYLFLSASRGTHGNELYYKDLTKEDSKFIALFKGFNYDYNIIQVVGRNFYILTNEDAANKKIILINADNRDKVNWKTVIPEEKNVIRGADIVGGKLFVSYLKDAYSKVYQYDLKGSLEKEIEFPTLGTAYGFGGKMEDKELFYTFTSFTLPPSIYKYNIETGTSEIFRESKAKFNPDDYVTKQVFYKSKNGTKIPMFVVYKKGLKLNGDNPVYLYGYGGFNASMTPGFNTSRIVLLENGFVFAMANLRGGGEYGEKWHRAGMLFNKQNVFDDFIFAAEYLIKKKYTSKDKIAIAGGSNGGLLVGACMTQRPELFEVALPAVGVMDMLRYHKFTVGWGWVVEYGSSEKKEHFKNLYSYSPLHNIKEGVKYPSTLVTTADHDDRVVPAHSYKFIATLQEKHEGETPVLIRVETKSGHGSSSISKGLRITADRFAFMFHNLGVEPIYK